MSLFSKCIEFLEIYKLKTPLLVLVFICISMAFFIPPEICELYKNLCHQFRFLIYLDKVFHFLFFYNLIIVTSFPRHLFYVFILVLGFIVIGFGIEIIQTFVPNRNASINDIIANILGIICGLIWKLK